MKDRNPKPDDLKASVEAIETVPERKDEKTGRKTPGEMEVVVRMTNDADRALHYISDVRATRYDPSTKTLVVALSDEGREVIPGAIMKLPVFRRIDPRSTAEIRLRVPDRIIKLSRSAPPGELAFETHQLSDAQEVVVEVAWADVPYYKDTRAKADDKRLPAARWEQHKARTKKAIKGGRKPKS
ncbi:MAG TPA: hypothetical protein VGW58_18000 [Pyrinomonadaceae bacterium]|nr:hypothetical protein [Pyrinomonadaceae bacterium]